MEGGKEKKEGKERRDRKKKIMNEERKENANSFLCIIEKILLMIANKNSQREEWNAQKQLLLTQ